MHLCNRFLGKRHRPLPQRFSARGFHGQSPTEDKLSGSTIKPALLLHLFAQSQPRSIGGGIPPSTVINCGANGIRACHQRRGTISAVGCTCSDGSLPTTRRCRSKKNLPQLFSVPTIGAVASQGKRLCQPSGNASPQLSARPNIQTSGILASGRATSGHGSLNGILRSGDRRGAGNES